MQIDRLNLVHHVFAGSRSNCFLNFFCFTGSVPTCFAFSTRAFNPMRHLPDRIQRLECLDPQFFVVPLDRLPSSSNSSSVSWTGTISRTSILAFFN